MFKLKSADGTNNICGKNLTKIRKSQKLSQRKLAIKMQVVGYDVDNHFIRRIENGERFVTDIELLALAHVLGVQLNELIAEDEEVIKEEKT